jgi:hypothetical protein
MSMLAECASIVIGPVGQRTANLCELAYYLGFGTVTSGRRDEGAEARPITFFLFNHETPRRAAQQVLQTIRCSTDLNIRFAPAIIFDARLSEAEARWLFTNGFDDVLCSSLSVSDARARLEEQLVRVSDYVETPTYLGPDRRSFEGGGSAVRGAYLRYRVSRDPHGGIRATATKIGGKDTPISIREPA